MDKTSKHLLIGAGGAAIVGGALAFALHDNKASAGAIYLQAVGGVLLAAAAVLAAGAALSATRGKGDDKIGLENLRAITGLIAVVVGIVAVAALTVVTITVLRDELDTEATIAITTSALGIVSTVITAYLGIKATANSAQRVAVATAQQSEEAVLARYEADIEHSKVDRLKREINQREKDNEIEPETARKLRQAAAAGEAEAKRRRRGPRDDRE